MKVKPTTTGELAKLLGCELDGDKNLLIRGAATIEEAKPDELTFLANPRYRKYLTYCNAGAIIITNDGSDTNGVVRLVSSNPYEDFKNAVEIIYGVNDPEVAVGIHPMAVIAKDATIGENASIDANVRISGGCKIGSNTVIQYGTYLGRNTEIGADCVIGVNVSIRNFVKVGNRVFIGDGSVLGYDGFGYIPTKDGYERIRPVGTVEIEDDVHIGANCCIDRATVGATRIAKGAKLDNLIQIAHGVQIGEHTAIAAQTGISGSAKIGSWVMLGGQVGMVGHIEIGDKMAIGAQSGVTKSFDIRGLISGYPARAHNEMRRIEASTVRLPELLKRVKKLEKEIKSIRDSSNSEK